MNPRPPRPPFTEETARQKVQAAEDAWNSRDPERVVLAYTVDTHWRNRTEFLHGRAEVGAFLRRKWQRELDYRLKKELPQRYFSLGKHNRLSVGLSHPSLVRHHPPATAP
jgi:nuclear transport factor 2 (NTF2) superfamily protein